MIKALMGRSFNIEALKAQAIKTESHISVV